MKSSSFIAAAGLALMLSGAAHAQSGAEDVDIPFAFTAGTETLPAGTYRFANDSASVTLTDARGRTVELPIVTDLAWTSPYQEVSVVFDKTADQRALSEVWLYGHDGALVHAIPEKHTHLVLYVVERDLAHLTGAAVYHETCEECHGPAGRGNPDADRFFRMNMPRLNSAYVQGKSDAELKEIVRNGRRAMDPVRIGQPGVKHLLPDSMIDSVVAYLRTLPPA